MFYRASLAASLLLLLTGWCVLGQGNPPAPAANVAPAVMQPILRVEAGGPTAWVSALAFSPDGKTLYAGGFDKVVRVWHLNAQSGKFEPATAAFRVPIGAGLLGSINTLAVSPDGTWLAVAGRGMHRTGATADREGRIFPYQPAFDSQMLRQGGTIYLFHTRTHAVRVLRGHDAQAILTLMFAPGHPNKPPLLVSAALERNRAGAWVGRVCLWDVSKAAFLDKNGQLQDPGALLDSVSLDLKPSSPQNPRPRATVSLAVRHAGAGLRQLRVAIAWGDGKLRMWDPNEQGAARLAEADDGWAGLNYSAAFLSDSRLLTGGAVSGNQKGNAVVGRFQAWNDSPLRQADFQLRIERLADTDYSLPHALAILASGGRAPYLAYVLRSATRQANADIRFCLQIADFADRKLLAQVDLWGGSENRPVLTASPDGRYLALAGNADNTIQVYAVDRLLRAIQPQPQSLHSAGVTMGTVAFVEKAGTGPGLLLSQAIPEKPGSPLSMRADDLVFDVAQRTLTRDPARQGWQVAGPSQDGWKVRLVPSNGRPANAPPAARVAWEGPGGHRGAMTIALQAGEDITGIALVPPAKDFAPVPVLVVASWFRTSNYPALTLYSTETQERFRVYQGHTRPIRSVAASRDGKLLASTAEDQAVCIWSLAGVRKILGQQGMIELPLVREDKQLVVDQVPKHSTAFGKLEAGDRLESLLIQAGDKPRTFTSPLEFYNFLMNNLKPGATVTLNVVNRQGVKRAVKVPVGQGVVSENPLLSLFVIGKPDGKREWIAWTSMGLFDASSKDAERYLGWHYNPAKLEEAVMFTQAADVSEKFRKPKLLKPLLAYADLSKALDEINQPEPIPDPGLDLEVDSEGQTVQEDAHRHILVRNPKDVTLRVRVNGPSFAEQQVKTITWRIDAGKEQPIDLGQASGQQVAVPLPELPKKGVYVVHVRLQTAETNSKGVSRQVTLHYQPRPPAIDFDKDWLKAHFGADAVQHEEAESAVEGAKRPLHRTTQLQAEFPLQAQVRPRQPNQEAEVTLQLNQGKPEKVERSLNRRLSLQPNENVIKLVARNRDALGGFEEFETESRTLVIFFDKQKAPRIRLTEVKPVGEPAADGWSITPKERVMVDRSRVRLRGRVEVQGNKGKVSLVRVMDDQGKELAVFRPDQPTFDLDQELRLRVEDQVFRVQAQAAGSDAAEESVTMVFHPPLPSLLVTRPVDNLIVTEGKHRPNADVWVRLTPPGEFYPFQVILDVRNGSQSVPQAGGQEQLEVKITDENALAALRRGEGGKLATVQLRQGDNQVRVRVKNRWKEGTPEVRHVRYQRPPSIVRLNNDRVGGEPVVGVTAIVRTPPDLPLTRVEINGREYAAPAERTDRRRPQTPADGMDGLATYEVRVPKVPLKPGTNALRFRVSNADGPSLEDKVLQGVVFDPRANELAQITIGNAPDKPVMTPEFLLDVSVQSYTPLLQVELRKGDQVVRTADVGAKDKPERVRELTVKWPVPLTVGLNSFQVVAVNAGGEAAKPIAITYSLPPIRLVVSDPPKDAADARVPLKGYVDFRTPDEAATAWKNGCLKHLRVHVNDFLQRAPKIRQPSPQDKRIDFQVEMVLNRKRNHVQVECPSLPEDSDARQEFQVTCGQPVKPGTLHLLVVGLGVPEDQSSRILDQAFRALQAKPAGKRRLESEVFNEVVVWPTTEAGPTCLCDYVPRGEVRPQLDRIRKAIERKKSASDVVLIYWLGRDLVEERGTWYVPTGETTDPEAGYENTSLRLQELLGADADTPGARVVLLDVSGDGKKERPERLNPAGNHAAVLRYAWSQEQVPYPGLLRALEQAASAGRPQISLDDVRQAAEKDQRNKPKALFTSNLKWLPPLASLVLAQKRP
jgi:WD40 repeat protein